MFCAFQIPASDVGERSDSHFAPRTPLNAKNEWFCRESSPDPPACTIYFTVPWNRALVLQAVVIYFTVTRNRTLVFQPVAIYFTVPRNRTLVLQPVAICFTHTHTHTHIVVTLHLKCSCLVLVSNSSARVYIFHSSWYLRSVAVLLFKSELCLWFAGTSKPVLQLPQI